MLFTDEFSAIIFSTAKIKVNKQRGSVFDAIIELHGFMLINQHSLVLIMGSLLVFLTLRKLTIEK